MSGALGKCVIVFESIELNSELLEIKMNAKHTCTSSCTAYVQLFLSVSLSSCLNARTLQVDNKV